MASKKKVLTEAEAKENIISLRALLEGKVTFGKSGTRAWQLGVPQLVLTPVEFVSKTELTILRPFRVELDAGRILASASFWAFAFGNIMPATAITAAKITLLACILECANVIAFLLGERYLSPSRAKFCFL